MLSHLFGWFRHCGISCANYTEVESTKHVQPSRPLTHKDVPICVVVCASACPPIVHPLSRVHIPIVEEIATKSMTDVGHKLAGVGLVVVVVTSAQALSPPLHPLAFILELKLSWALGANTASRTSAWRVVVATWLGTLGSTQSRGDLHGMHGTPLAHGFYHKIGFFMPAALQTAPVTSCTL